MDTSRICPVCHAEVTSDLEFCNQCGAPLPVCTAAEEPAAAPDKTILDTPEEKICPACHASVKAVFQFCNQCGTELTAAETKETPKSYDYTLPTPKPPDRLCPACKAVLQPDVSVCPRCGRKLTMSSRPKKKRNPAYLIVSIVLYSLAGCFFLAALINVLSMSSVQNNLFSGMFSADLFHSLAVCMLNGITSLILTLLGSTFLLLYKK